MSNSPERFVKKVQLALQTQQQQQHKKCHLTHTPYNLMLNKEFTDQVEFDCIFKSLFFPNLTNILNRITTVADY